MPADPAHPSGKSASIYASAAIRGASGLGGCFFRLNGTFVILTSLGVAVLGWLILGTLADNHSKNPEELGRLPSWVISLIDHRAAFACLAIPPLLMGVALLAVRHVRAIAWQLFIFAILWLIAMFLAILMSFISSIAPLYEYQPL